MIVLWNAMWQNQKGNVFTYTVPILRIMLRVVLTHRTDGTFENHNFKNLDNNTSDIIGEDTGEETGEETGEDTGEDTGDDSGGETGEDNGDSNGEDNENDEKEDVWIIRRKPSNPDAIKKSAFSLFRSLGSFGFNF
jgi:hypothetical protein